MFLEWLFGAVCIVAFMRHVAWLRTRAYEFARAYLEASTGAVYLTELRSVLTRKMKYPITDDLTDEIADRLCREGLARRFMTDTLFGQLGQRIDYLEGVRLPRTHRPQEGGSDAASD